MKLAEALQLRSDMTKRLQQLKQRLLNNARYQEGDEPAEDPLALLDEYARICGDYEQLIKRINLTNCAILSDGVTMTGLIASRDAMTMRLNTMRDFLDEASTKVMRHGAQEIKVLSSVNVPAMQKKIDELSQELRELNNKIQSINWTEELK